jgi:histone H2B
MEEVNDLPRSNGYIDLSNALYRVLKLIHPELEISKNSISTINAFLNAIFDHLMTEADRLARLQGTNLITEEIISEVVRTLLKGELAKHAVYEGKRLFEQYRKCAEGE